MHLQFLWTPRQVGERTDASGVRASVFHLSLSLVSSSQRSTVATWRGRAGGVKEKMSCRCVAHGPGCLMGNDELVPGPIWHLGAWHVGHWREGQRDTWSETSAEGSF